MMHDKIHHYMMVFCLIQRLSAGRNEARHLIFPFNDEELEQSLGASVPGCPAMPIDTRSISLDRKQREK